MPFTVRIAVWLLGSRILLFAAPSIVPLNGGPGWMTLHQLGSQAYGKENYAQAEQYFAQALAVAEQSNINDARLLANLNNLASTYTQLGKVQQAETIFERFRPFRDVPQTDSAMIRALIESDANHAAFTIRRGKPREALLEFESNLETAMRVLGPDDTVLAQIYNHLALLYRDTSQFAKARQFGERALAIREKAFGPKSLPTAASLSVLSQVIQSEGNLAEAEPLCRRALAIRREIGAGQPRLAESLSNLGTIVKGPGNYAEAERMYKEAQQIWAKTTGPASFESALAINNLGTLYQQMGKLHKAEDQLRRAAPLMERAAGPASPSYALVLANLSALYREEHKWEQAEAPLRRALEIDEAVLGATHRHVAMDLSAIAQIDVARGDNASAETLLLRALSIHRGGAGKDGTDHAEAAFHLAMFYQTCRKPAQAEPYFSEAMKIWKVRAPADLEVANALELYAAALKRNQQFAKAEEVVTTAVGMRVQAARNGTPKAFPGDGMASLR